MKSKLLILLLALISSLSADEKTTVELTGERGHRITGGIRVEVDKVQIDDEWELSTKVKIKALENKLAFYRLMESKKVDLTKPVSVEFNEKLLSEALKELLPDVDVEWGDVNSEVTVGSMKVKKAPLGKVLEYLDDAASVYFIFSEKGVRVSSKL